MTVRPALGVATHTCEEPAGLEYVRDRTAFGTPIGSFQNSRFLLAELTTEVDIARIFVDHCIELHTRGELTAVRAAEAKWWTTELQVRVADCCRGTTRSHPRSR